MEKYGPATHSVAEIVAMFNELPASDDIITPPEARICEPDGQESVVTFWFEEGEFQFLRWGAYDAFLAQTDPGWVANIRFADIVGSSCKAATAADEAVSDVS